jgi:hypothetical protein
LLSETLLILPTISGHATKRNNRKIHARKFLATPEGKAGLAQKQEEAAEIKYWLC